MMKPSRLFLAFFTCGALSLLAAVPVHGQTKTPDPALLAKAKIAYPDAEKTALKAVPGAAVKESELEHEDGGLRWSFDLVTPGSRKVTEVGVDAITGKVIENKVEGEKDEEKEEREEKKEHRRKAAFDTGAPYRPAIDPARFSEVVHHPYFTLTPGTTFTYKGSDAEGTEINKVTVTDRTKEVMGVTTRVVWDQLWLNGRLAEETYDWYAQDKEGNVWYFGEESSEHQKGGAVSTKGSWEAGVDGALPGIVMQANPQSGDPYRQEYRKGEAEDLGQILGTQETVTVPAGTYKDCVKTKDWSAIEAGNVEHKYYSKETGSVVMETENHDRKRVELVEVTRAGG